MTKSHLPKFHTCVFITLCSILHFSKSSNITNDVSQNSDKRASKNLFPFVWLTIRPSTCGTVNDIPQGACIPRGKCAKRGGTANGNCQNGLGDCCMFTERCSENRTEVDASQLVTVLESPTTANLQCSFRFRREENICQIRLDFAEFTSAGANYDGICDTDRLRISGSVTVENGFTTCGTLTGQHMYLTFGSQETIEISPLMKMTSSRYRIVATKIPCDSKTRVPDYCLQQYTKPTDIVRSFDFSRQQQSKQMYTICVKPLPQSESIQWKPCTGVADAFSIASPDFFNPPVMVCSGDWIQVKGGDKRCLPFAIETSTWKPYELLVNFNDMEVPPPPMSFPVPLPPGDETCSMRCQALVYNGYTCDCNVDMLTCICIADDIEPMIPGMPSPDFDNKGFCLEYTQL